MIKGHWDYVLVALVCIALFLRFVWILDDLLPSLDRDLAQAHNFDESQEHLRNIITDGAFNNEQVDPYIRIDVLENEIHGLYSQLEEAKEIIYSLRHIRHSEPQNGESDLRGTGHSSPIDDSQDCA